MKHFSLVLLIASPSVAGCFLEQTLDLNVSHGSKNTNGSAISKDAGLGVGTGGGGGAAPDAGAAGQGGGIGPINDDGGTSVTECDMTRAEARAFLENNCAF